LVARPTRFSGFYTEIGYDTKEQVAADLPPKTVIIETITLSGAQRDLYESIRVAMDQRVRAISP